MSQSSILNGFSSARSARFSFILTLAVAILSLLFAAQVHCAQVTVAWDAGASPVVGYKVYYGTSTGNYASNADAGANTSWTLPSLSSSTYYIAATAYDSNHLESSRSQELVIHSLTASAGTGGTITPSGTFFVSRGSNQTFTIAAAANYHVVDVLVDGQSVGAVSSYTATGVMAPHTIAATFAVNVSSYTITASAGANGSISPSGAVSVSSGAGKAYTITPAAGYHVSDVLVDGASVGAVSSYTFTNVTSNRSIAASFAVNAYTITASAGANGSISPSGAVSVSSGAGKAFTITPAAGYHVSDVLVDGASVGAVSSYTFTNVTSNRSIAASFAVNAYTITASAGANGSISPSGAVSVSSGAGKAYTITPAAGYHVSDVLVDGASVGAVSSYTFTNVTSNRSIAASFAVNAYTITASAGANGSISPSGAVSVSSGASRNFSITPASGYHVADVLVDGASVGAVSSYTFTNVTSNRSIAASFAVNVYTITASAGANGSISPSGSVSVSSGAGKAFTITPAIGYQVTDVTVDGASVGAVTSYSFSSVTANHSIAATFSAGNQSPIADAGPDQNAPAGSLMTLNGSNSTDPENGQLSHLWTQTGGAPVSLSSQTAANPTFTAPTVGTTGSALIFKVTVTDPGGLKSDDTCIVNVTWVNQPPTAYAGPQQTVNEGVAVALDGNGSTDPDDGIASYLWEQTDGPAVSLEHPTPSKMTFTAPDAGLAGASLSFRLTVTDKGGLKATGTCIVNVAWVNMPPQANAGADQTVNAGDVVVLDGFASSDPDDGIASYAWKQAIGTPVTMTSPTAVQCAFTAPLVSAGGETLTFGLTVTDSSGLKTTGTCNVNVKQKEGADLTGNWQSISRRGYKGSGLFTLKNTGDQAAGAFSTSFYLSSDGVTLGTRISKRSFTGLEAAQSTRFSVTYYPRYSSKYIIAVIDGDNRVTESNEQNNRLPVMIP